MFFILYKVDLHKIEAIKRDVFGKKRRAFLIGRQGCRIFLYLIPVDSGRNARIFFKTYSKILRTVIAHLLCDFINCVSGCTQKLLRLFHSNLQQMSAEILFRFLFKQNSQIRNTDIQKGCNIIQAQILLIISVLNIPEPVLQFSFCDSLLFCAFLRC